jgi:hypothetical protein
MAKIRVTVKVEIEQPNGDYSEVTRTREHAASDNPKHFAEMVEKMHSEAGTTARNAVIEMFGDYREDR